MAPPDCNKRKITRNIPFSGVLLSVVRVQDGAADHKRSSLDLPQPQPKLEGQTGMSDVSGVVFADTDGSPPAWTAS